MNRLVEGSYHALNSHRDDLQNQVGGDLVGASDGDQTPIRDAFKHGRAAGVDEDADIRALERDHESSTVNWQALFPTQKELGVRNLHQQFQSNDHQSVVFARFVDTINSLPQILPGNTATITGDTDQSKQETILEEFIAGETDTIVMTYGVGTEGLDLSNAHHVVLFGMPQSAEQYHNARGRVRRGTGPKFEHILIHESDSYSYERDRYQSFADSSFPVQANEPDPTETALTRVTSALNS